MRYFAFTLQMEGLNYILQALSQAVCIQLQVESAGLHLFVQLVEHHDTADLDYIVSPLKLEHERLIKLQYLQTNATVNPAQLD